MSTVETKNLCKILFIPVILLFFLLTSKRLPSVLKDCNNSEIQRLFSSLSGDDIFEKRS